MFYSPLASCLRPPRPTELLATACTGVTTDISCHSPQNSGVRLDFFSSARRGHSTTHLLRKIYDSVCHHGRKAWNYDPMAGWQRKSCVGPPKRRYIHLPQGCVIEVGVVGDDDIWILTTSFRPLRLPLGGVVLHRARLAIYTPSARAVISCHHALPSISYRAAHGFLKPLEVTEVTNRCTATVCYLLPSYLPSSLRRLLAAPPMDLLQSSSRPSILPSPRIWKILLARRSYVDLRELLDQLLMRGRGYTPSTPPTRLVRG